jgi:hypothetical protein
MESRCALKRREKFLGIFPVEELDVPVMGVRRNDSSQVASAHASS